MKTADEVLDNELSDDMFAYLEDNQVFREWIKDAMYNYADQFKPQWIRLDNKLPDGGQKVDLWLVPDENNGKPHRISWTWEKSDSCRILISGCKVTHWMPLPEKPL